MIKAILNNWSVMRGLRLVIGIIALVQSVIQKDITLGLIAGFLLLTAIANVGCCGSNWITNNKLYFIGALFGALAGFLYWKYIGCLTGTCSITSNPLNSTIYFALFGAVLFGAFKKQSKTTETDKQ